MLTTSAVLSDPNKTREGCDVSATCMGERFDYIANCTVVADHGSWHELREDSREYPEGSESGAFGEFAGWVMESDMFSLYPDPECGR